MLELSTSETVQKKKSIDVEAPTLISADNLDLKKAIDEVNSELNKIEAFFLHETQDIDNSTESKRAIK